MSWQFIAVPWRHCSSRTVTCFPLVFSLRVTAQNDKFTFSMNVIWTCFWILHVEKYPYLFLDSSRFCSQLNDGSCVTPGRPHWGLGTTICTKDAFTSHCLTCPNSGQLTVIHILIVGFACLFLGNGLWRQQGLGSPQEGIGTQALTLPSAHWAPTALSVNFVPQSTSNGVTATSKDAECLIRFQPEGNLSESREQKITHQEIKNGNHFVISEKKFVTVNVIINRWITKCLFNYII